MPEEKHPIRNGIIVTVVGGVILAIILALWNTIVVLLKWLVSTVGDIWMFIISKVSIPWIILILLVVLSLPTIWRFAKTFIPERNESLSLQNYRQDTMFNVVWKWAETPPSSIRRINGFCVKCQTRLVYETGFDNNETVFVCEKCGTRSDKFTGDIDNALGVVWRQIERKINTGEWKNIVEQKQI